MKKLNFDLNDLQKNNRGTSWQKAILLTLVVFTFIILASYLYLAFRPLSNDIKTIIDEEISAVDINFNQKTIDEIKERQKPADVAQPISGKNPFVGF